jgi:hypothetical protein
MCSTIVAVASTDASTAVVTTWTPTTRVISVRTRDVLLVWRSGEPRFLLFVLLCELMRRGQEERVRGPTTDLGPWSTVVTAGYRSFVCPTYHLSSPPNLVLGSNSLCASTFRRAPAFISDNKLYYVATWSAHTSSSP